MKALVLILMASLLLAASSCGHRSQEGLEPKYGDKDLEVSIAVVPAGSRFHQVAVRDKGDARAIRIDRGDVLSSYAIDFQLMAGENPEFVFWLPVGSQVVLTTEGKEVWRKSY